MFWDKFHTACSYYGKKPNAIIDEIGVSSATITKWKNGSVPGSDQIKKISDFFSLPTDFFLEVGPFSQWDALIEHKDIVVDQISSSLAHMSIDILYGMDDISFIKMVYAFNIQYHEEADGFGISSVAPYGTNYSNLIEKKNFFSGVDLDRRILVSVKMLSEDEKIIILGKALELLRFSSNNVKVEKEEPMQDVSAK